jgi:serine/threonine protein kinase
MSYCLNPDCQKPQNFNSIKFCQSCGTKLILAERYRAIKLIGAGGFGRTLLAEDEYKPSKPRCVIKQFYPQGQNNAGKAAELFQQEAVRLEKLGEHPQIPELFAHFEQDNHQYIVQEYIDGQNLAQELVETGTFPEAEIRSLLDDLLPVLEFIHAGEVIHRDIKPENIIRRRTLPNQEGARGGLVLVDFGAAKFATATALAKTGTTIGSAGYSAPEQGFGKAVFASDLYSLGVTLTFSSDGKTLVSTHNDKTIKIWRVFG